MTDPLQPVPVTTAPGAKHGTAARGFQGIPGLEIAPGGRLWATWYSGGKNEGPDNFVLLVTSMDQGRSWTEPVVAIDPPGANIRAYDSVLWIDPSDRLWLFWAQCFTPCDGIVSDGINGVWGIWTTEPDSSSPRWSEPVRISNGVMMNKPVALSTGEWALPTAVWEYSPQKSDALKDERFSNITLSADIGETFFRRGGASIAHRAFDEHMIVELKDGRLWMLVRTLYGIGQSYSSDGGKTWSPGEDSGLGGPNSRFFIRRLLSGNLLLVNHADIPSADAVAQFVNGATWRKRSHLMAFLSSDDGRSWQGGLLLDEREGVSYPDGAEDKTGLIRIIYDRERYKEGEILMASFREADILAGKPVSKECQLRQLINKTGGVK